MDRRSGPAVERVEPKRRRTAAAGLGLLGAAGGAALAAGAIAWFARAALFHALCSVEVFMRLSLMLHAGFESFCAGR